MSTVTHMLPMQGFRPGVNPRGARALAGLGSQAMPISLADPAFTPSDATDCSTWDFFFNKSAWDACANAAGQRQIQSVAINAENAGYSPAVVAAAQDAASTQEAQVPSDTSAIADFFGAGSPLASPGSPAIAPWWLWVGVGVLAVVVIKNL